MIKESERIRQEALSDNSDNDYRSMNYEIKIKRAEKKELFDDKYLPLLRDKYVVTITDFGNTFIITTDKYGKLSFYPKSNSLFIHRRNYWCKNFGLKWIKKYLL
jgi:hypothetical protein